MKAKIRDTELFFDVLGEGIAYQNDQVREKPVMFCLHGGPGGDHSVFKKYISELQEDVQLVMMDHRGSGRSKRGDPDTYTLENNIEDVEALRQHLGLDKIIVYGHSYGGNVAQGYALKYPEHVSKLILGVTVSEHTFIPTAKKNLQARGSEQQIAWGNVLFETGFTSDEHLKQFFLEMAPMYSNKAKKEGVSVNAFDTMIMSYQCINKGFLGFLTEFNYTPLLHNIKCPTLVFAGRDDWICPPEFSEKIAAEIENAQLVIFEKSGHSVPSDQHEDYIQTLRTFVQASI